MTDNMTVVKLKRAWCYVAHWRNLKRTNGLGWIGWWCPKCGYSFFAEWEDGHP
jgi:hypothetical protein